MMIIQVGKSRKFTKGAEVTTQATRLAWKAGPKRWRGRAHRASSEVQT